MTNIIIAPQTLTQYNTTERELSSHSPMFISYIKKRIFAEKQVFLVRSHCFAEIVIAVVIVAISLCNYFLFFSFSSAWVSLSSYVCP